MSWLAWVCAGAALLVVVLLALRLYGARRWQETTGGLLARVEATRAPAQDLHWDPRGADDLPAPVQRYFRTVLRERQPMIAAVQMSHRGSFNLSATAERWKPFESKQRVILERPGFVWDARVELFPGLSARVHDAYVAGEGILHASLGGVFSLARMHGGGELARGELMRFLAEAAWYPTRLLPGRGVRWEPLDDRSAQVTLADADTRVTLVFHFSDRNQIETVRAAARGRIDGDRIEQLPWEGRFWNFVERSGVQVPLDGEVAWLLPTGRLPYWRGTLESLVYEFAR